MIADCAIIYTDGSCHTQLKVGAWAAIVLVGDSKTTLSNIVLDTTHNRMELMAVIMGLEHLIACHPETTSVKVYSDSQYLVGLRERTQDGLVTQTGKEIRNADLVARLSANAQKLSFAFEKVKAHGKKQPDMANYNREADMLCRKIMREAATSPPQSLPSCF